MNDDSRNATRSGRTAEVRRVLLEAAAVAAVAAAIGFAANALSPRGLSLTRHYFPGAAGIATRPSQTTLVARIRENGLQWVDGDEAAGLFRNPGFREHRILFVDARDVEHYAEGHIPGAYEFDPYHPEKKMGIVLPVCQAAEKIVVYCNGGECEDSQFAAIALRDAGIPNQKLFVYAGGIGQWKTNGLPLEAGDRDSANLQGEVR